VLEEYENPITDDARAYIQSILVIDDEADCNITRQILTDAEYIVDTARDGGQAHATFKLRRPDFIIMELLLPGESGYEICERFKKMDDTIPIMALTRIDLDASRNLAARVGIDGYLTKPFSDITLLEMIQEVAEAVWDRVHGLQQNELGSIRFQCKNCKRSIAVQLKNKGKATFCPECNARINVPQWAGSRQAKLYAPRGEAAKTVPLDRDELLKFVTVKCQHCGVYYRLRPEEMSEARICPKCHQYQEGALSIVGAPMSRAALESSRRVLMILEGKYKGKKLLLPEKPVFIGRHKSCAIRENDENISKQHCRLKPTTQGLVVSDLGSETGTFINGHRITEDTLMQPMDILRVGSLELQLTGKQDVQEEKKDSDADSAEIDTEVDSEESGKFKAISHEESFGTTAEEAAHIIQFYWELLRKRADMKS